jgi:hypothetical protein
MSRIDHFIKLLEENWGVGRPTAGPARAIIPLLPVATNDQIAYLLRSESVVFVPLNEAVKKEALARILLK